MTPEEKINELVSAIVAGWRTRLAFIAAMERQIEIIETLLGGLEDAASQKQ